MLFRKIHKSKRVKGILLIAYLGFIGYFAFISKIAGRTRSNINAFNLVPFYSIGKYLKVTDFSSLVEFVINILGNIIVFIPVGIFIPYLFHKKTWAYKINFILIMGFLFSLSIESIQFIMSVGVFDVDDLILNTLGALMGWKLYCRYMIR